MLSHLYRFRSIEMLLGKNELENGQIYFSPPEDLNDPVEGFKDLQWLGDAIVWRNLLKHYVLCLLNIAPACFIGGADFDLQIVKKVVAAIPSELPDAPIRSIYQKVVADFLAEPVVNEFVELMAARSVPIRKYELTNYLRSLHSLALQAAAKQFAAIGLLATPAAAEVDLDQQRENISKSMKGAAALPSIPTATEWSAEMFFTLEHSVVQQLYLYNEYQIQDRANTRGMKLFTTYFPTSYVEALERLVHPDLYIACFSATVTDAAMWGQYGRGHRGVALKFKMSPSGRGIPSLPINRIVGVSGGGKDREPFYHSEFRPLECQEVKYGPKFPPIDFFTSLGALPQGKLFEFWYRGDDKQFSATASKAFKDQAARDAYWKAFEEGALYKTTDWKHEQEHRMLLHSGFPLDEPEQRTLTYKFEDLAGIVFGARTDLEDKLRIMRIIDKKCGDTKRSDFEFFEIVFMPETSTFLERKLDIIKIKYD